MAVPGLGGPPSGTERVLKEALLVSASKSMDLSTASSMTSSPLKPVSRDRRLAPKKPASDLVLLEALLHRPGLLLFTTWLSSSGGAISGLCCALQSCWARGHHSFS